MKFFVARVTLTDGNILHPLTVITNDQKDATKLFLHFLTVRGLEEKELRIMERPLSDLIEYDYDVNEPDTHVREHINRIWQSEP